MLRKSLIFRVFEPAKCFTLRLKTLPGPRERRVDTPERADYGRGRIVAPMAYVVPEAARTVRARLPHGVPASGAVCGLTESETALNSRLCRVFEAAEPVPGEACSPENASGGFSA